MSEEVSNKINYFDEYMTEQIPIIQNNFNVMQDNYDQNDSRITYLEKQVKKHQLVIQTLIHLLKKSKTEVKIIGKEKHPFEDIL